LVALAAPPRAYASLSVRLQPYNQAPRYFCQEGGNIDARTCLARTFVRFPGKKSISVAARKCIAALSFLTGIYGRQRCRFY